MKFSINTVNDFVNDFLKLSTLKGGILEIFQIHNPEVGGSCPPLATSKIKQSRSLSFWIFC